VSAQAYLKEAGVALILIWSANFAVAQVLASAAAGRCIVGSGKKGDSGESGELDCSIEKLDVQLPPRPRGLHSSNFRLNVSALCEIGGAFRIFVWGVLDGSGGMKGSLGCILCQKRLRLSRKMDECKPLPPRPPLFKALHSSTFRLRTTERKRRFRVYKEAPGFRPRPRQNYTLSF